MKKVCLCASFKFYKDVLKVAKRLEDKGIECLIPIPSKIYRKQDKPADFVDHFDKIPIKERLKEAKKMEFKHFQRIDQAGIIYIIAKKGYVGRSVCVELGYALAKGKTTFTSEKIKDFTILSLVDKVLSVERLIKLLTQTRDSKT